MAWLKKKSDPLSKRARALSSEIAALEAQIKQLDASLTQGAGRKSGAFRSTALPHGATITHTPPAAEPPATAPAPPTPSPRPTTHTHEPIFEELGQKPVKSPTESSTTPEHYNELGVRKYDVTSLGRWLQNLFRRPPPMNPRLVSYLAAGGVQGLQPLRREKRVARNRFLLFAFGLLAILIGTLWMFLHNR